MPARPARLLARGGQVLLPAAAFGLALGAAPPAWASGPYVVDDAAITPADSGQVESFASLAGLGHSFRFVPEARLEALPFVEWSVALDTARLNGRRASGLTLQAKALAGREAARPGDLVLSASAAVRGSLDGEGITTAILNGIVTAMATERLLIHGNVGVGRDFAGRTEALTRGARTEAILVPDRLAAHAELFGATDTSAGVQLGLRPTLLGGAMDHELVFSRNPGDERASWATLGLAVRF